MRASNMSAARQAMSPVLTASMEDLHQNDLQGAAAAGQGDNGSDCGSNAGLRGVRNQNAQTVGAVRSGAL